MKRIGKTFHNELEAAGLIGLPISYSEDGNIEFHKDMQQVDINAVNAVYDAHDPDAADLLFAKQEKIDSLTALASVAINSGFESTALVTTHKYDSEQHNIDWNQAVVVSGTSQPITCDDLQGNADSKQPRVHDATQAKQVLEDGMAALLAHKSKLITLRTQVMNAADEAAVNAINW